MDFSAVSVFLVGNIPASFHAYDLRAFFSHFTEKKGFACFHFRHRPEYLNTTTAPTVNDDKEVEEMKEDDPTMKKSRSVCCVIAVKQGMEGEFVRLYRGKNWSGINGESIRRRVKLKQLQPEPTEDTSVESAGADVAINTASKLTAQDLSSLPELNPPRVMPQGNVGTCLAVFMALIRACQLPSFVIRKLRLEFPKSRSKRRYGAVPPVDFQSSEVDIDREEEESVIIVEDQERSSKARTERVERSPDVLSEEEKPAADDDHDYDAEEWERYEALHDDVDKQERTKERLYEEDMEVVWEKGGSGLVFYTDASHWDQMDGDFDEKCSQEDDWDVDMSAYYNYESADRYAMEIRDMAKWKRLKSGDEEESVFRESAGFSSGIGGRVLKQSGWKEGAGLGKNESGISHALEPEGQLPHCKKGLGYHGEKLDIAAITSRKRKQRSTRDVIISTIYDQPNELTDTTLRSAPSTAIKYRQQVKFVGAGLLHPKPTADRATGNSKEGAAQRTKPE